MRMKRFAIFGLWLGLAACSAGVSNVHVELRTLCEEDGMEREGMAAPTACHQCASDDDCVFKGNVCTGEVFCSHRDAHQYFDEIGCVPEPPMPSDEGCVCRRSVCRVR
jgi:hypothetical protein